MPAPALPHPEYAALIETIRGNFADAAPRLIASDWIEDHDDGRWAGRVEFIRKQAHADRDWWWDPAVKVGRRHGWADAPMTWRARDEADPDVFHPRGGDWPDDPLVIARDLLPEPPADQTVGLLRVEWRRGFVTDVFLEGRSAPDVPNENFTLPEFLECVWPWQPIQRLFLCSPPVVRFSADARRPRHTSVVGRDRSIDCPDDEVAWPKGMILGEHMSWFVDQVIRARAPGLRVLYTYLPRDHELNRPFGVAAGG